MTPSALRAALREVPLDATMRLGPGETATVLAIDHALFRRHTDRVDAARLAACMAHPRARFTVASVAGPRSWLPIGYTAWFPLADADRDALLAGRLDRHQLRPGDGEAVYLFAWGMLRAWRGHGRAATMLRAMAAETAPHETRLALLLTRSGARVAHRFGLAPTGVAYGDEALWATPMLSDATKA